MKHLFSQHRYAIPKMAFCLVMLLHQDCSAMRQQSRHGILRQGVEGAQRLAERQVENAGALGRMREELETMRHDGTSTSEQRSQLAERINRLEQEQKGMEIGMNLFQGAGNILLNRANLETKKAEIEAQGRADQGVSRAKINEFFKHMMQPDTLLKTAGVLTLSALGIAGVYYSVKLGYDYANSYIGRPTLVRDTSRGKFWDNLFGGTPAPSVTIDDIVLSPDMQRKAVFLAEDTKQNQAAGLPFQNVLFYGPPGTGKTEFAKALAKNSGMDYAILSGADFSQFKNGESVVELHKLFDWGKTGDKGLIIFIDEADACLRDRATLDKDGVNLVNAFLSRTGSHSEKYMLILATNYEDELDAAVRSRIHKKIPFELPGQNERVTIAKKKIDKYIINDTRTYEKDGVSVTESLSLAPEVNNAYLEAFAQQIDGFSGRDIDYLISEVRQRAYRTNRIVNKDVINEITKDKITEVNKDKLTSQYQKERFNAKRKNQSVLSAAPAA